ncbi:TIGR02569 family protein [soil metagenome]
MSRPPAVPGRTPPPAVLRAFGVRDEPVLLDGGQYRAFRAGGLVLKPVDDPPEQHDWLCETYAAWSAHDLVRVPEPVAADAGWSAHGWSAHRWLEGGTVRAGDDPDRFRRTAEAFHDVVAPLDRPSFLDVRDDAWSFGDRVAFEGATPVGRPETLAMLEPLLAALRPVETPFQVIHGDLGGNVLRAPGRPDAVIDWPPYFRPRGFVLAVTAGDAVAWEGAPASLLDRWADVPEWDQLLLRAVVYRVATRGHAEAAGVPVGGTHEYAAVRWPVVDLVLARLG